MATTTMAVSPQRCWLALALMLSVFATGQAISVRHPLIVAPPPPPSRRSATGQWLDLSGRPTSQSSTGWDGHAARAIDGNRNTNYGAGSCTHTNHNNSPWWHVRLAGETTVYAVQVTNRGDCCGERLNGLRVTVDGQLCASGVTFSQGETKEITCTAPVTGTDVRLEIPGYSGYLTLCEVAVRGAPRHVWFAKVNTESTKSSAAAGAAPFSYPITSSAIDGLDPQSDAVSMRAFGAGQLTGKTWTEVAGWIEPIAPPTHAGSTDPAVVATFWADFEQVVDMQAVRRNPAAMARDYVAGLPTMFEDFTVAQAADAVEKDCKDHGHSSSS